MPERNKLFPLDIIEEMPKSRGELFDIVERIKSKFESWIQTMGPWPQLSDLKIEILSRREMSWHNGYSELKIRYTGEKEEWIPAYLLIPRLQQSAYPAVVAHHQCNVDCDVGSDAVVGKAVLRPDQAYGFELVQRGFVVLAPESINCGIRNVEGVRKQGMRGKEYCWGTLTPNLSVKTIYLKHLIDAVRSVDVLISLDYVDKDRIGMIGHSMGAGTTFWAAAYDSRIKAAVSSCHFMGGFAFNWWAKFYFDNKTGIHFHELLMLISNRSLLFLRGDQEEPITEAGDFKTKEDEQSALRWLFKKAKQWSKHYHQSTDSMQLEIFSGGHSFPAPMRKLAYEWLAKHV
jgi:dienelactone hydrolase